MRTRGYKAVMMAAAGAAMAMGLPSAARAETWNETIASIFPWNDGAHWVELTFPNAPGAVANIGSDLVGDQTITVPGSTITVGVINLGDTGAAPDNKFTIGTPGAGTLIFDNGANDAQVNALKEIPAGNINLDDVFGTNITLNSNLVVNVNAAAGMTGDYVRFNGAISDGVNGPKSVTFNVNVGFVEVGQAGTSHSYSGGTFVNGTGRLRYAAGGGFTLIPGDITIAGGATLQDSNAGGNAIADSANINMLKGFWNLGGGSDTVGSLEGTGPDSDGFELAGGAGTLTYGANNLDKTYNGRFGSTTSFTKIGTGVQTLGGTLHSWQSSGTRNFRVNGGRVDLNKTAGVTSVAQTNVFVGDGTQTGANRPELRLLQSDQIVVRTFSGVPTETNVMTLNSGIFNVNNNSETVGSVTVTGAGISTMALGTTGRLNVAGTLQVDAGATGEVNGDVAAPALVANAVTINGKLDLQKNKLVTNTAVGSWDGTQYTGVYGMVQTGRGTSFSPGTDPLWDGPSGIITSMTDATDSLLTGLAVSTGAELFEVSPGVPLGPTDTAVWAGQTVTGASTLVMYTWGGDAELDGDLDGDDYFWIDSNVGLSGTSYGYHQGDFDYDGDIDGDDYFIIDSNIAFANTQPNFPTGAGVAGMAAVPEPSSLGLISLAASALMRRRRRA